jgi:hypothetical protein
LYQLAKGEKKKWVKDNPSQVILFDGGRFAEDYLISKDQKLRTARCGTDVKDLSAYEEGKEDSKKIDVRAKHIKYS